MSPPVILASQSVARRALLRAAGVDFTALSPGVDEDAVKARVLGGGAGPQAVAVVLAAEKALAIAAREPGLVIGADQTLELDGALYDKAPDMAVARARLKALRGRTHQLHAAVAVAEGGTVIWRETATATLRMRNFSDGFLDAYLAAEGEALLGSVGCYRLEGLGAQLFEGIDGDYFAILGLPLLGMLDLLRRQGVLVP